MIAARELPARVLWQYAADDAASALHVRDHFVRAIRETPLECGEIGAEIVFDELVSNVMKHAPGPIAMTFEVSHREAFLRVYDRGNGFVPRIAVPTDLFAESGRGLFIARQFCSDLTVDVNRTTGCCVSAVFQIAQRTARSAATRRRTRFAAST